MRVALAIAVMVGAGCADLGSAGDDTPTPDAPAGCSVSLVFEPMMVIASPQAEIRVSANVTGASGVLGYTWQVTHGGADVTHQLAGVGELQSAITFFVPDPGPYRVMVAVNGTGSFCPTAQADVNVGVPGGALQQVRLRVYPPAGMAAPPQEKLELIPGGADWSLNNVTVDTGVIATGHVRKDTTGVPSYLRFIPLGGRDAYVEAFTASDGAYSARVLNTVHDVLVVPTVAGFAPRLVKNWMPGMAVLAVDAGIALTGTVLDPSGSAVANAHVQIELDGIPSTLATTNGAGGFSVLATVPPGAPEVHVEVTPPPASGLPRIAGASTTLVAPFTVRYSPALQRRDVGGAVVRRGGVAQPDVPVKLVGEISAVATINTTVSADGELRIATRTNGAGALPNGTLAPAAPLFAVSTIGTQLAVDAFDLTTAVPATIDAPPAVVINTQLRTAAQVALPNALIDLAPAGALELAGAQAIRATSNAMGDLSLLVPSGARFDVRASDPLGRAAPLLLADVPTANLSSTYALNPRLRVTGTLLLSGNPQPVGRGTVQILCTLCEGVDRSRPLAEGATSSAGAFDVAIFDPGAM
ncbi:MAG: carboxypeptidase-like regulatory domain-containing protein [Myxococcota bacterium]|nr:carboxypeptidase-like regulatory domain-containing protein [Myxococcota bacterium]